MAGGIAAAASAWRNCNNAIAPRINISRRQQQREKKGVNNNGMWQRNKSGKTRSKT